MSEKLAGYKKIGVKSFTAWAKTGGIGILLSLLCFIVAIILIANSWTDYSGLSKFNVVTAKPFTGLLLIASFIFPVIYVVFANQYALKTLLYQVWRNKLVDFIIPKIDSYVLKLSNLQPNWFRNVTTVAAVKAQLLDQLRKDKSVNKIQRVVLNYGFQKLNLDNTDFQQPENVFTSILIEKVRNLLNFASEPSPFLCWMIAGVQILLLIVAIIMN